MTTLLLVFCLRFVSFKGIFTFTNVMKSFVSFQNFYWRHFPSKKLEPNLETKKMHLKKRCDSSRFNRSSLWILNHLSFAYYYSIVTYIVDNGFLYVDHKSGMSNHIIYSIILNRLISSYDYITFKRVSCSHNTIIVSLLWKITTSLPYQDANLNCKLGILVCKRNRKAHDCSCAHLDNTHHIRRRTRSSRKRETTRFFF